MKYIDFKNRIRDLPVFSSQQLTAFGGNMQVLRNQLTTWCKKGLVIQLRKGLYVLNDADRRFAPSRLFLANQLYQPSYISTEYALHYYDLIPERVTDVTSVTPRKSAVFENRYGRFVYQHVKVKAFSGYHMIKDENGFNILIAEPEKAMLDLLRLNPSRFRESAQVIESLRLQNTDTLRTGKLLAYSRLFECRRLKRLVNRLVSDMRTG
jgi:predicted transcriptional regulator of viral defense system